MPYYHNKCGGEIRWFSFLPIPPKCKKCGKRWNPLIIYGPPRKDMTFAVPILAIKKGTTSYAGWADKLPGVSLLASRLPNWPRWARILSLLVLVTILSFVFYLLFGG